MKATPMPEATHPSYWSVERTYVYSVEDYGPVTLVLSDHIPAPARLTLAEGIIGLQDAEATFKLRAFLRNSMERSRPRS